MVTTLDRQSESNGGREAFTLAELLVVIAILSILAALLLPALSKAKVQGHAATCKSHLRQMGMALQMYVHENGSKYPYLRGIRDPSHDNVVGAANTGWWWAKLLPYYQVNWMDRAYHCPGYKGAFTGVGDHHGPLGSYAYNAKGVSFGSGFADPKRGIYVPSNPGFGLGRVLYYSWPWLWPSVPVISEAQIKMPSGMFAIGESRFFDAKVNGIPGGDCDALCGLLSWRPARDGGRKNSFAFDPARHGKNYNQLFCDGHVTAMSPWVLFNPTNTASMWNSDHQPHCELWVTDD